MNDIVRHKTIPAVDVSDQALVERAMIDHVETLLDWIRWMDAPQALQTVVNLTEAVERRGRP